MRLKFLKSSTSKEKLSRLVSDDNISKVINAPVCTIIGMNIEFWRDLPRNYLREDAKQYFENDTTKSEVTAFRNSSIQGGYFIKAANSLGLSVGVAVTLMIYLKVMHPPAASNPLVVLFTDVSFEFILFPVIFGAIEIIIMSVFINKVVLKRKYPKKKNWLY